MNAPLKTWRIARIDEIAEINPRPEKNEFGDNLLASFIPMKCVEEESGRFEPLGDRKVREVRKGYTPFRDGDVIFAKVTPCMENGKAAVLKGLTNGIGFGSTEFYALRPKADLLPEYLFLFITQQSFRKQAARNMTGAVGLRRVPKGYLAEQPIPFPPLPEQRQIVTEIEKQFTRLDAGVTALRQVQANLKRYRAAVLKAACEGKLVPTEAELAKKERRKYETGSELLQRILAERRQRLKNRGRYLEPKAVKAEGLGSLPEGWDWATFEQISERVTVGFVGSMKHEYVKRGVPFLRGQNVRENRFDSDGLLHVSGEFHKKLSKSALHPGDLAVVRSGSVGVTCVIPDSLPDANCSDLVLVQRPLGFVPQYGAYYMNSLAKRHVEAGKVGVALTHFNTKSVAALAVPLPPLVEQTRIVAEAERRLSVIEELETAVTANLHRATRLRQAILKRAFEGGIA
jgi:type I restriction enzyme, S subunit